MTPQATELRTADGVRSLHQWRSQTQRWPSRYRVLVVGPSFRDVVQHLGGWLFDITAGGREVTVIAADQQNAHSLKIIGASALDFEQALPFTKLKPDAVVASVDSYRSDERVRACVSEWVDLRLSSTFLWGQSIPAEFDGVVRASSHRVSSAGRAFKMYAQQAVGITDEVSLQPETFWTGAEPANGQPHLLGGVSANQAQ